jgi:cytoskeleton protein RodZ
MALQPGSIGARLRAGREKLGLTVLQVAERIHTDPKIVEAIEADNFPALGAPVYARGHIRHYAELVGESATELIALYSDQGKVAQPDLTQIVKAPSGSESSPLVLPALVVIAVFAIAGAIWWVSALSKKKPQLSETHVVGDEQPASASSPSETGSGNSGGSAPSASGASAASGTPVASGGVAPGTSSAKGNAAAVSPRSVPGASGIPPTAASHPAGAATTPPDRATALASTPVQPAAKAQVTLRYSADSWTEVYDASGSRLFYDVGSANSVQTVVGMPPLRVVLGNASGVAVEFNGHSTPVAKFARPDGSVQFSINRSGHVIRAKPVADGG